VPVTLCDINNLSIEEEVPKEVDCLNTSILREMFMDYIECSFSEDFRVRVVARSINEEPFKLRIVLKGCSGTSCIQLTDLTFNSKPGLGVIEQEYAVVIKTLPSDAQTQGKLVLDYELIKAYIESTETAVVNKLLISTWARCNKVEKVDYPMLKVDKMTRHYTVTYIDRIGFTGLIAGYILNTAGITLMILGVYSAIRTASKT